MVKTITFSCDICDKDFPPQEYSFLNGYIVKIDKELKANLLAFEGHYCGDCTKKIIEAIEKIKNEQPTEKS